MTESTEAISEESRWPPATATFAVLFLVAAMPDRLRVISSWVVYAAGIVVLVSMAAVALIRGNRLLLRIENVTTSLFVLIAALGTVAALLQLINVVIFHSADVGGIAILESSVAIWLTNILAFLLLYWRIDRGGPNARAHNEGRNPDWVFPQAQNSKSGAPDWRPMFLDYLYLGYCTATAFSPTDTLPLTRRAKMLMMVESTISLVTTVITAARAINILR